MLWVAEITEFDEVCVSVLHKWNSVMIATGSVDSLTGLLNPSFGVVPCFSYMYRGQHSTRTQVLATWLGIELFGISLFFSSCIIFMCFWGFPPCATRSEFILVHGVGKTALLGALLANWLWFDSDLRLFLKSMPVFLNILSINSSAQLADTTKSFSPGLWHDTSLLAE